VTDSSAGRALRWSWKRAATGAFVGIALSLIGGSVAGMVEARRGRDPASRIAIAIATGANCAAFFAIVGTPAAALIAGFSRRRRT